MDRPTYRNNPASVRTSQLEPSGLIRVDERRRFRARILLVDSNNAARQLLCKRLNGAGFNVAAAASRSEGLAILDQAPGIELIICAYSLGDKDRMGGVALADKLQNMWIESRPDRVPSVLLTGSYERLEQEIVAEEHGAHFTPIRENADVLRKVDLVLLKRRQIEHQQIFSIEHLGRTPATTYCLETELVSAIRAGHRTKSVPLQSALRERLTFDMLARYAKGNRWLSLKDLTGLLQNSEFHSKHDQRAWRFSPRSLKESLHLLRNQIEDCTKELRADFRVNQLLLTKESGRYERLYKLNCEVGWMHP